MTHLIEEAITEWFGERCPDYEYGCSTCDAWAEYDERVTETEPIESFGERLIEAATEAVTMAKLMRENEELRRELAEERALCDRLAAKLSWYGVDPSEGAYAAYRKARGL